jgi:lipopolysaccharide transport system permease protein
MRVAQPEIQPELEVTVIDARTGLRLIDWRELWQYRDLFRFLVWRGIKTRYAQSVLGVGWAIIQPIFTMIVFTVVFGNLAKINSDGVPYAVFSYTALVPWTYFSGALTGAGGSLIGASNMITKVYFPRLVVPLAPVLSKLVDFAIAFGILIGLMFWFQMVPNLGVLLLPLLILLMMLTALGIGMWLTALSVQYRDINYATSFFVQLLMYASPVVYPASSVPEQFRLLYGLNPMAGVIEGFRSALLGTQPMPWDLIGIGSIMSVLMVISGLWYFRRMERIFADVV